MRIAVACAYLLAVTLLAVLPVVLLGPLAVAAALPWRRESDAALRPESRPSAHLPAWAWPWSDPNNGCWGDVYWRTHHHPADFKAFGVMWRWLAWRNPATGWLMRGLGVWGERIVRLERRGCLFEAWTDSGRWLPLIECRRFRILWGWNNTNVDALGARYWYEFTAIFQPWVNRSAPEDA